MTKPRRWYKRKRIWLIMGLTFLFVFSRTEFSKMRYDKEMLQSLLQAKTNFPVQFDTRQLGAKSVQYLKIGQRAHLPLIIFIHGSPGALNAYEEYLADAELLPLADLIAIDRLGFGYSDFGEAESSMKVQAEAIAQIARDYPDRKKILVGHSMGGPVIARFAMDFPNLADALLMIAPSISPELEPSNTWRKFLNLPFICWITPAALRVCNQEIIPLKAELETMMSEWACIRAPLTVVQGELDELVPMENAFFAEKMMEPGQVKLKMIPGGNHFILWNDMRAVKEELLELVRKFGK